MFEFEAINLYNGSRSTTGTVEGDLTTRYFMRSLYQRCLSVIEFTVPKEWSKNYFKNVLFGSGFIGIVNTAKYGIIPQICGLHGQGIFLQPTKILVHQPLVQFEGVIGKDCELIRLTPDYLGVWDIIEHYAIQLSTAYTSLKMSLVNSRLAYILAGKDKSAVETLKLIAEKISAGETTIIIDKMLKNDINGETGIFESAYNPKDSYITTELLADINTILANFDREIGIPSLDEKRERYIESEVQTMNADSCARLSTWKECLTESIDKVNALFDLGITLNIYHYTLLNFLYVIFLFL